MHRALVDNRPLRRQMFVGYVLAWPFSARGEQMPMNANVRRLKIVPVRNPIMSRALSARWLLMLARAPLIAARWPDLTKPNIFSRGPRN